METSPRKCVAPFYAVAVLWLAAGALVPLYEPMHYGLLAAVSVVVFLAVNALCRCASPEDASSPKAAPAPGSEAAAPAQAPATGNPDLDKILKDGQLAISEMKRLDANIADPGISADIVRLEQVSSKIFEEVRHLSLIHICSEPLRSRASRAPLRRATWPWWSAPQMLMTLSKPRTANLLR